MVPAFQDKSPLPDWTTVLLGWQETDLQNVSFLEFVHPDDRTAATDELARVIQGGEAKGFLARCRSKDDSWRWLAWNAIAEHARGYVYAAARDVTERRAAQDALRRREENISVTLNSIGDGVLATDARGRVTALNPVAQRLTGWTDERASYRRQLRTHSRPDRPDQRRRPGLS